MDKKELTAMIAMEYLRGSGLFSYETGEYINNASEEEVEEFAKNVRSALSHCSNIADIILDT